MMKLMQPFAAQLQFQNGLIEPYGRKTVRRLSDMRGMYLDIAATEGLINQGDPLLYEVYEVDVPHEQGQLIYCTSIIYPGKVGDEYYMTKGHFHSKESTAEMYLGLQGRGYLLMQTHDGKVSAIEMRPGTITYIPPFWAHRTINIGDEKFVFFGVYPGDAGHNYGTIEEGGFAKLVVEKNGKPALIDNPRYRWSRQGARHLYESAWHLNAYEERMPRVLVKFLASMKDKVGRGAEEYELPDGSTLSDLAVKLQESHHLSLLDPAIMVTLNGKGLPQLPDGLETRLCEGDTILLFPPISGG